MLIKEKIWAQKLQGLLGAQVKRRKIYSYLCYLHFNSRKEHVARCSTICSIACTDIHPQHSTYRRCKQLLIILQTLGDTAICPQHWRFYFIRLFICSVQDPHPPLALTFDRLLAICWAALCSFSQNLYLPSLSYIYSSIILTSLLSILCEPDIVPISTHLSPTLKELTYPPLPFNPDLALYNFYYFHPSPLSPVTANWD